MLATELEIARKLKAKNLPQTGSLVRIFSSENEATDPFITQELLNQAINERTSVQYEGQLITGIPIKDFSGTTKGVLVFVRDAVDDIAMINQLKWGIVIGGGAMIVNRLHFLVFL